MYGENSFPGGAISNEIVIFDSSIFRYVIRKFGEGAVSLVTNAHDVSFAVMP